MMHFLKRLGSSAYRSIAGIKRTSRIQHHKRFLPKFSRPNDKKIVQALTEEGAYLTSLEQLGFPSIKEALPEAYDLIKGLADDKQETVRKSYANHASEEQLLSRYNLILFGLEERFLRIVENYLALPVSYRGLTFRRDRADGIIKETRLWHRDDEDFRITKMIIYLSDVDAEGGPFEYIPKYHTPDFRLLRFTAGRVLDEDMRQVVPESKWKSCQGPAGTVLFADPCNILHRGKIPITQDRFTLFYGYNSRNPLKPQYCQPLFSKQEFLRRVPNLTNYQKSCISEK